MGGNYLYICMYVCMYVCMYTMILPLHFSVPIYSPWQKKKKKKKNTQKIKRGAGPLPGPEYYIYHTAILLKQRFSTDDFSESKIARDLSFSGSVHMTVTTLF